MCPKIKGSEEETIIKMYTIEIVDARQENGEFGLSFEIGQGYGKGCGGYGNDVDDETPRPWMKCECQCGIGRGYEVKIEGAG